MPLGLREDDILNLPPSPREGGNDEDKLNRTLPLSKRESDTEEKFEDAYEIIPAAPTMTLESSLEECTTGLYLFLNNRFSDAVNRIQPWSKKSPYHALLYSILMVVKAILTFDPQDINNGVVAAREALKTCNSFRKKSGLSFARLAGKQEIRSVKEEEIHAEVCYAECLILKSTITIIQHDNLFGFLKSSISIGSSYQIYKDCQQLLPLMPNNQSQIYRHLKGGIKFGLGTFNLMLSLMPPKTLKLLNIVGYSGDRELGLALLHESATEPHINNILSVFTLLFYYCYIRVTFGVEEFPNSVTQSLFLIYIQKFPNCFVLKFFGARFSMLTGDFEKAQLKLQECIYTQNEWKEVHHLCYWELMWCHIFLQNWRQAYYYTSILSRHSKWSKAVYSYSKAMLLALLPAQFMKSVNEDMSTLFLSVESLRIKFFGNSVPIEKYFANKGHRYATTRGWYTAQPLLEFIYAWSGFRIMSRKAGLLSSWLTIIDKGKDLLQERPSQEYGADDLSLLNLLKGLCLRLLGEYLKAEHYFTGVIEKEKLLKYDHYLVPYAYYELGMLYYLKGDYATATKTLDNIKNYKDYSMEARLQFRVHIALEQMVKGI